MNEPHDIDIEHFLDALRPPSVPDAAFDGGNAELRKIKGWKKSFAVSVLAGLSTEPAYYANGIRIDWLQRLVFSKSEGERKPQSAELSRVLNAGLERAGVLRLEDPSEDLFCDLIATPHGNHRIFTGQWEAAGPYTQTLLDAFVALPSWRTKQEWLDSIHALLAVSDAIAARANVHRLTSAGGVPQGILAVPSTEILKRLARRVRLTAGELVRLGVSMEAFAPFMLDTRHFPFISTGEPGDTPLEFHPLLAQSNGIIVASPAAISLAVRAAIVRSAQRVGAEKALLSAMLLEQQKYSEMSGFWPVRSLELSPPNRHFLRSAVCRFAEGRFLHVIQVPATFDQFPDGGFASMRALNDSAAKFIADDVSRFWSFLETQPDCRQSATVLLLSGWGTPHSVAPPIDHGQVPGSWRFIAIGFADTAVLGACENGTLGDLWRIVDQTNRLDADGFSFENTNGILNLFGWWRRTGGNLIPEHMREIEPPCHVMIPTDEILAPRVEAATKRDLRVLALPDAASRLVQRVDWSDADDLQPIYGSLSDLDEGRLLGAVFLNERTWWIESTPEPGASREWCYRIWHAVLEWLAAIGARIMAAFPKSFPTGASRLRISIPADPAFERRSLPQTMQTELATTVIGSRASAGGTACVQIQSDWITHVGKPENDAEVELVAAIVEQIAAASGVPVPRDRLSESIREAIGSRDWRWLHARPVATPLDRLASGGIISRFHGIPLSATSLVKCGSVWSVHERSEGLEIDGEEACRDFLTKYRDHILNGLISQIRSFNRERLVTLSAGSYQSARLEQSSWRGTIRALRAIHGTAADTNAFRRQNSINAVQRAAKSVCEIAACEAPQSGGADPGLVDTEELFARALLLFGNGQLFASVRAGLIKPTLRLSPAGDLLSDRSIFVTTLRPVAEWENSKALDAAAETYMRQRTQEGGEKVSDKLPWDDAFREAVEAEYGVPAEAFIDLQHALIQIAETRKSGTFVIQRSALSEMLVANEAYHSDVPDALLERLTLPRRPSWAQKVPGMTEADIDLARFDRPFSLINRPLLAIADGPDPFLLVAPILVSDSIMYSLSGLLEGTLHNQYWTSAEARKYAGMRADVQGREFEESVAKELRTLGLTAWPRRKLSWALNEKVADELGDIDVLAVSADRRRVWVIEAKNLRLCRTEAEVAARLTEYRGRMVRDSKGRDKPDKLLRHIRRVQYLRQRNHLLSARIHSIAQPEVRGLLIVDAPQPINFHMLDQLEDSESVFMGMITKFQF